VDRSQRVSLVTMVIGTVLLGVYGSSTWHKRSYGLLSFLVVDLGVLAAGFLIAWYFWRQDNPRAE